MAHCSHTKLSAGQHIISSSSLCDERAMMQKESGQSRRGRQVVCSAAAPAAAAAATAPPLAGARRPRCNTRHALLTIIPSVSGGRQARSSQRAREWQVPASQRAPVTSFGLLIPSPAFRCATKSSRGVIRAPASRSSFVRAAALHVPVDERSCMSINERRALPTLLPAQAAAAAGSCLQVSSSSVLRGLGPPSL